MEEKLKELEKLKKSNDRKMKILISIAIIIITLVFVLFVLTMVKSSQKSSNENLKQREIEEFNSKFDSYIGENISDQQVRVLISKVIELDSTISRDKEIIINYGNYVYGEGETTLKPSIIPSNRYHMYSVKAIYDDNGYINSIIIIDN